MTDKIKGFTVTLSEDLRDDDAKFIAQAIGCLNGVYSVKLLVGDVEDHMARMRVRHMYMEKIMDVFDDR